MIKVIKKYYLYIIFIVFLLISLGIIILTWGNSQRKDKTPSKIAFAIENNAYVCFLEVYRAEGHNEFVRIFEKSYKSLSNSPSQQKFDFLLFVFLYCNLDAGNWLIFSNEIQKDNNFFWKQLCVFIDTDNFKKLSKNKQREIKEIVESFKADKHHFDVD